MPRATAFVQVLSWQNTASNSPGRGFDSQPQVLNEWNFTCMISIFLRKYRAIFVFWPGKGQIKYSGGVAYRDIGTFPVGAKNL